MRERQFAPTATEDIGAILVPMNLTRRGSPLSQLTADMPLGKKRITRNRNDCCLKNMLLGDSKDRKTEKGVIAKLACPDHSLDTDNRYILRYLNI